MARTPLKDKSTEKTERITIYLTKAQMDRVNRYVQQKLGEPQVDSSTARMIILQHLDKIGFE